MTWINLLFSWQLLTAAAGLLSWGLHHLACPRPYRRELMLHYMLVALALGLPLVSALDPFALDFEPLTKSYVAQSYEKFDQLSKVERSATDLIMVKNIPVELHLDWLVVGANALLLLSLLWSLWTTAKELKGIHHILRNSHHIKRYGRLKIVCSDAVSVPFSFHSLRFAWVVLPTRILENSQNTRLALLHELQHHRQGDTLWLYAMLALRSLTAFNPFQRLLDRTIAATQELTVDATLVDEGNIQVGDYARCLLEVARNNCEERVVPSCAIGPALVSDQQLLTRRIEQMFIRKKTKTTIVPIAIALLVTMVGLTLQTGKAIGSAGFTLEEARALAARTPSRYPLKVNQAVVDQLNRYTQTAQGREFMRAALKRMAVHRNLVLSKIKEYGVPEEILAIPIIESGYRNLAQPSSGVRAAGLWQFIPGTARAYGLRVEGDNDERLDIPKETDAAMRLLKSEKIRFGRWPLAVLAYNAGDGMVMRGVLATNSSNVWDLIEQGYEGDRHYMAKFVAAILIMKHPSLID